MGGEQLGGKHGGFVTIYGLVYENHILAPLIKRIKPGKVWESRVLSTLLFGTNLVYCVRIRCLLISWCVAATN